MTIADLKVGAKLVFGAYGVGDATHPITWLKANREGGEFLSEFVLDLLKFDAEEQNSPSHEHRYYGNADYGLSNIFQFMNSYEDDWFNPSHQYDCPPGNYNRPGDRTGDYLHHPGFLNAFEDYEIECLAGSVNLPTLANIFGANGEPRMQFFNRKGFRGRPSSDLVYGKHGHCLEETSYCEYWLSDGTDSSSYRSFIGRDGSKHSTTADNAIGFRPKCVIKPTTEVEPIGDGSFRIVPFEPSKRRGPQIATDEELLNLMGLL